MAISQRRRRSREQLLTAIRAGGGVSRADLRVLTGLSRSAVADGVQALRRRRRSSSRTPRAPRRAGGRRRCCMLPAPRGIVAGIDFGHAHVSVALAGAAGEIVAEQRAAIEVDEHAAAALDTARAARARAARPGRRSAPPTCSPVAAGIPGPLDHHSSRVRSPTILAGWVDVAPDAELERRIGRPVLVANDADMGAQGELRFGAARGCRDFMYVKASHGIGAGLVLGGETYRGAIGVTGEIGHTQVAGAGNLCRCGNRGCLETVVSITEFRRQLGEAHFFFKKKNILARREQRQPGRGAAAGRGRTHGRPRAGRPLQLPQPRGDRLGRRARRGRRALAREVRESIDRRRSQRSPRRSNPHRKLGLRSELIGAIATATRRARRA